MKTGLKKVWLERKRTNKQWFEAISSKDAGYYSVIFTRC